MGKNYRQLKAHGKSIILERQENIVIERSDSQLFKRKQTIVREKFPHPNDRDEEQQHTTTISQKQEKRRDSKREAIKEIVARVCETDSHEEKLTQTAKQLGKLALEIDIEIEKLQEQRDLIMHQKPQSPTESSKRNAAIQNDMTWDQNLNLNNSNIEFTIEKYSSQHKFVCTSPRYGRDEQTSCRPRMRTIGLQKNTHRTSGGQNHKKRDENQAAKCIAATATAAATAPTKEASFPASLGGCFEYVNDNSLPNVLNVYHNHHTHNPVAMTTDSGCRKYCQRYNATGNYNGLVCNQKTYVETGVTPCTEYNYCCDEYTYDYPNSCYVPLSVCCGPPNVCGGGNYCTTTRTCCSGRPKHSRSRSHHRRCSGLNPDDFARFTSPDKTRRDKSARRKIEEEKLTKKYMIAITERQKKLEGDELRDRGIPHGEDKTSKSKHRSSKSKERRETRSKERHRESRNKADEAAKLEQESREKRREESAAKISKYLTRGDKDARYESNDDSEASSSLRKYKVTSKEKLLKITLTKQKQKHHITTRHHDSDDDCFGYTPSQCSIETLRTLKKMRITAYRPSHHRQQRDEDTLADRVQKDSGRKGKHTHRKDDEDNNVDREDRSSRDHRKKRESPRDAERPIERQEDDALGAEDSDEIGKERKYAEYIDKYKQSPTAVAMRDHPKDEFKRVKTEDEDKIQSQQMRKTDEDYQTENNQQEHQKLRKEHRVYEDNEEAKPAASTRMSAEFEAGFAASSPQAEKTTVGSDYQQKTSEDVPPHAIYSEPPFSAKKVPGTLSPDTIRPNLITQENGAGIQYIPEPKVSRDVLPHAIYSEPPLSANRVPGTHSPDTIRPNVIKQENVAGIQYIPEPEVSRDVLPQPQQQQFIPLPRYVNDSSGPTGTTGYPLIQSSPRQSYAEYDTSKAQPAQREAYNQHDLQPVTDKPTSGYNDYNASQAGAYDRRIDFQPSTSGIQSQDRKSTSAYNDYNASQAQVGAYDRRIEIQPPTSGIKSQDGKPTSGYNDYNASQAQPAQAGAYDRRIEFQPATSEIQSQYAKTPLYIPQRHMTPKEFESDAAHLQSQKTVIGTQSRDTGRRPSYDLPQQNLMQQLPQYVPQPQRFQYAAQQCEQRRLFRDGKDVRFDICGVSEQCYEDEELQCAEEREHTVEGLVNLQCDALEITAEYASARLSASTKRASQMMQKVPEFTGCPCMLETYLNLVSTYCNGHQRRNSAQCAKKTINC